MTAPRSGSYSSSGTSDNSTDSLSVKGRTSLPEGIELGMTCGRGTRAPRAVMAYRPLRAPRAGCARFHQRSAHVAALDAGTFRSHSRQGECAALMLVRSQRGQGFIREDLSVDNCELCGCFEGVTLSSHRESCGWKAGSAGMRNSSRLRRERSSDAPRGVIGATGQIG
jgi:hypothetical protein